MEAESLLGKTPDMVEGGGSFVASCWSEAVDMEAGLWLAWLLWKGVVEARRRIAVPLDRPSRCSLEDEEGGVRKEAKPRAGLFVQPMGGNTGRTWPSRQHAPD